MRRVTVLSTFVALTILGVAVPAHSQTGVVPVNRRVSGNSIIPPGELNAAAARGYLKGDLVRLEAPATGDVPPDSRIIAVPGDRIRVDTVAVTVNDELVEDVPLALLQDVQTPWDQVVPDGHYFVIGERREGLSTVQYHGLIPAEKIVGKVGR